MAGWQSLVRDLTHRIEQDLLAVLDGLDPALLDTPLGPESNTIGWLLWHLTRSHDRNVNELRGLPQRWLADGWHARFGREPDPDETGYRHTAAEVAAFRSPDPDVIRGYHRAVVVSIEDYLDAAPDEDLDRLTTSPTLGNTATVQRRLVGVLLEGFEHVGQAALIKGILVQNHRTSSRVVPESDIQGTTLEEVQR